MREDEEVTEATEDGLLTFDAICNEEPEGFTALKLPGKGGGDMSPVRLAFASVPPPRILPPDVEVIFPSYSRSCTSICTLTNDDDDDQRVGYAY